MAITLAVAFGTGYLMQNGSSIGARLDGPPQNAEPTTPVPAESASEEVRAALPELPADALMPQFGQGQTLSYAHRISGLDAAVEAPKLSDARTPAPFTLAESAG